MAIKINQQQEALLKDLALENYINELKLHCYQNFPYIKNTIEEDKLKEVLRIGVNKAYKLGYTQRGPVLFYIDLLFIFGFEFETDPQYPWLIDSLSEINNVENTIKSDQLKITSQTYKAVIEYKQKVLGDKNQYYLDSAEKIESLSICNLKIYKTNFERQMIELLKNIYPQKFELTPYKGILTLINKGQDKANHDYYFDDASHVALIIILMFLLGHEFDHDPFYEWASFEKTNVNNDFPAVKAEKLEGRTKMWLHETIINL